MRATIPYPLSPGAQPVAVSDGGNAPVGLFLINAGDNGGSIVIQPGPTDTGAGLTIGPGGSIPWNDPAVLPYAKLPAGATKAERLVVSSQLTGYDNPQAVAVATALQIATQGVPSTLLDTGYGMFRVAAGATAAGRPIVGPSASLIVSVEWPQPAPQGPGAVRLTFDDPDLLDLAPVSVYLTNSNAVEERANTWQIPVLAPRLTITNMANTAGADAYVSVVGSNRTIPKLRQLGGEMGTKTVWASTAAAGMSAAMQATNVPSSSLSGGSGTATSGPMTRANGPVTLQVLVNNFTGGGILFPTWVDETATVVDQRIPIPSAGPNDFTFQWNHPTVPVYWRYFANTANAGNFVRVTVLSNG